MRAVRPDRGEELSRRAGGHPVPAPLAKRLSGFLEVRVLAGSRCSGLVSMPPHLHVSETLTSMFASVVQALDLAQPLVLVAGAFAGGTASKQITFWSRYDRCVKSLQG